MNGILYSYFVRPSLQAEVRAKAQDGHRSSNPASLIALASLADGPVGLYHSSSDAHREGQPRFSNLTFS